MIDSNYAHPGRLSQWNSYSLKLWKQWPKSSWDDVRRVRRVRGCSLARKRELHSVRDGLHEDINTTHWLCTCELGVRVCSKKYIFLYCILPCKPHPCFYMFMLLVLMVCIKKLFAAMGMLIVYNTSMFSIWSSVNLNKNASVSMYMICIHVHLFIFNFDST